MAYNHIISHRIIMKYNYIPTRMAKIKSAKHFGIWKGWKRSKWHKKYQECGITGTLVILNVECTPFSILENSGGFWS